MKLLLSALGGAIAALAVPALANANPYYSQRQVIFVQPGYSAARPVPVLSGPSLVIPFGNARPSVITFPAVGAYPTRQYYEHERRYQRPIRVERPVYFNQSPTVTHTRPRPYWGYGSPYYQQPTVVYPGHY